MSFLSLNVKYEFLVMAFLSRLKCLLDRVGKVLILPFSTNVYSGLLMIEITTNTATCIWPL